MSAPEKSGETRGQPSLRHALGEVQRLAIAPLTRLYLTAPVAEVQADSHAEWKARRTQIEGEVARALADQGAFVAYGGTENRISYAGITASSSQTLFQAVKNWRQLATQAIGRGEGR